MQPFLYKSELHEPMEFTGERMVPEGADAQTFWEHVHRYRFAARYVRGKRVLDIACGEGYGTAALLKAGALNVIGVDVSIEACRHAHKKYGIDARVGNAENIPLPDGEFDVVVSFETLEHVPNPARFLDECVRVLAPKGILIVSTPNKDNYSYKAEGEENPYHCSEIGEDEFVALLKDHFTCWRLFTQMLSEAPMWSRRGFAMEKSPWSSVRGVGRLRRWMISKLGYHLCGEPGIEQRRFVVEKILMKGQPLADWVNPYILQLKPENGNDQPRYFIALAQK